MSVKSPFVLACLSVGMAASLSACQTTTDPTQGGLLGGISGLTSGAYDQRVQERKQNLENEEDANLALARAAKRLDQQKAATRTKLSRVERDYASLSSELHTLQDKLSSAEGQNSDLKGRLDALQKQIDMVQSDPFASEAIKQQRLEALRRQHDLLKDEVDAALGG